MLTYDNINVPIQNVLASAAMFGLAIALTGCVEETPEPDVDTTPPSLRTDAIEATSRCESACMERGDAFFATCIESGRSEELCLDAARQSVNTCMDACDASERPTEEERPPEERPPVRPPEEPPAERPEPDNCEEACGARARAIIAECFELGGDEEACNARGRAVFSSCLDRCEAPPERPERPEPDSCEEACGARARAIIAECLELGGDEEACNARGRAVFSSCLDRCEAPPERPEPDSCEEACGARARAIIAECLELGGDEEACNTRGRAVFSSCLDRCEAPPERPEPDSCEEACGARARVIIAECLELGGDEEACNARGRAVFSSCLDRCEAPPERPEPDTCENGCAERARVVFAECLELGGDEDLCSERSRATYTACVAACDPAPERPTEEEEPPGRPEPQSCEDACAGRAETVVEACFELGGDEVTCGERGRATLSLCLAEFCR